MNKQAYLSGYTDKEAYGASPIELAGTATGGLIGVYLGHLLKKSKREALTQGQKLHWSEKATPWITGAIGAKIGNRLGGGLKEMQHSWEYDRNNPE